MKLIRRLHNPQPHIQQLLFTREDTYYVASWNQKKDEIEVFRSNITGTITDWAGMSAYVDWINYDAIERMF